MLNNTDEVYDVFDESGAVVGKATWTECHSKGLLHQSACALIFKDDSRQEVLLQRRSENMSQDPGLWQHSAGGHVVSGETLEEGVHKEIREELFSGHPMPDFPIRKVSSFFNHDMPNNYEILYIFEAIYPGPFFYDTHELAEPPQWISWDALSKDIAAFPGKYTVAFRNILKEYAKSSH